MYWPTSSAKLFSPTRSLPSVQQLPIIHASLNSRKTLFLTLTARDVCIWRVRPTVVVAELRRSEDEIDLHGTGVWAGWSPDGSRIVIQTDSGHLMLLSLTYGVSSIAYETPRLPASAARQFTPAPGEGFSIQPVSLRIEGVVKLEGGLVCTALTNTRIYFAVRDRSSVQCIPFPSHPLPSHGSDTSITDLDTDESHEVYPLETLDWLPEPKNVFVREMMYWRKMNAWCWIVSDGSAWFVTRKETRQSREGRQSQSFEEQRPTFLGMPLQLPSLEEITCVCPNFKFSVVLCGTSSGKLFLTSLPPTSSPSHTRQLHTNNLSPRGKVLCADWTSDGYAVAVSWSNGWGMWSVGGRELGGINGHRGVVTSDRFVYGVAALFWTLGNQELFMIAPPGPQSPSDQIFAVPIVKSAITGQQAPDNARYAFLQMDDRVLVYRGADQPDMSVINPESDVWQHIKIPPAYLATNWPIRYASISTDGRLIAIAGRRGLVHYSSGSGRWKMFVNEEQEQAFAVRGGLLWFHHVLVAAIEQGKSFQIRLYSRDSDLSHYNVLHTEEFLSPVHVISLIDNSLLVYTTDNDLYHFLIIPTKDSIRLHLCGSISFNGVITTPTAVRGMSWMIPTVQKQLGDPTDDLIVATIIMLIGGKLVLLRPRKAGSDEVRYDMQILSECIEFCWTQLRGVGALENSLWGFDGTGLRLWLDALTIEAVEVDNEKDAYESVKESVRIPVDSYPLSVLTDKGVIIGVEPELTIRESLPFAMFKVVTTSHLFIQHVLRFHLDEGQVEEAVDFASYFQNLAYFSHALEMLLHSVLEDDNTERLGNGNMQRAKENVLALVVEFLDHFDESLEVVVGVARKTEMARWQNLFDVVGNPRLLFEECLSSKRLTTAASYLLVLHTLEQLDESHADTLRLLRSAAAASNEPLQRELMRFLRSIDDSGQALERARQEVGLVSDIDDGQVASTNGSGHPSRTSQVRPVPDGAKRKAPAVAGLGFLPATLGPDLASQTQSTITPDTAGEDDRSSAHHADVS